MMKYTNILINGDYMNFNNFIIEKPILKEFSIVMCMPLVTVGFFLIGSVIPYAIIIDGLRYVKYKHIKNMRYEKIQLN